MTPGNPFLALVPLSSIHKHPALLGRNSSSCLPLGHLASEPSTCQAQQCFCSLLPSPCHPGLFWPALCHQIPPVRNRFSSLSTYLPTQVLPRTLTLCFTWTPGSFEACDLEAQEISHWGVGLQPPLFAAIPRICK